jgi:hypothetical protein
MLSSHSEAKLQLLQLDKNLGISIQGKLGSALRSEQEMQKGTFCALRRCSRRLIGELVETRGNPCSEP